MNPQQLNRREKKRNAFTATIKQDSLRNMDPDFKQWVKKKYFTFTWDKTP